MGIGAQPLIGSRLPPLCEKSGFQRPRQLSRHRPPGSVQRWLRFLREELLPVRLLAIFMRAYLKLPEPGQDLLHQSDPDATA